MLVGTVGAQELPGRASVTTAGSQPLLLTTGSEGTFSVITDVLFGSGGRGPYSLSRKPINRFTESVTVDNRLLQRDFDYQVDYTTGTITFTSAVGAKSVIHIEFSCDPSKSVPNRAPLSMPISLDLLKKRDTALQFTGLYKQADPSAKSGTDLAVYGLTGGSKAGQTQLSSMMLFSPDTSGGQSQGTSGQRTAMKFGSSTKTDTLQLSTSYLRVGEKFAGAKDFNLQRGVEAMDMSAVYTPGKSLSMSSSYKRNEILTGEKKGEALATTEHKIVVTPDGAPKLTIAHAEVQKEKPGAQDLTTTTDIVQLEQKLGGSASAVATREAVTTGSGGDETRLTTNQIVLDTKPSDNLAVRSRVVQKESSKDGGETGYGMEINAAPSKTLTMKAAMSRVDAEKTGKAGAETLNLVANPSKLLNLEMNVAHSNTDASGDQLTHALKVVSNPWSALRLELGLTGRNVETAEDEFARTFMLSTTPLRNMALQFDWAERDSQVKGDEQSEGIRVVTSPIAAVKLSGALSQKETPGTRAVSKEAGVELRPFSHTTIGGAYKEVESNGAVVSRVSEVSASTKPVGFVELSGGYKTRATAGQENLDTMNVAMKVGSGGFFNLTGAYSQNPEDKKGIVQRMNTQSLGLKTDFGRLKLKGAYTLKDEYLAGRFGQQKDFGLDLRLSQEALLTSGYSVDERREACLLQTSVYSLGFVQRMGSTLNLYLTGKMTTYERDRLLLQDQTEYEGEARLGLKF